jgi:hypothetical protein
MRASIVASGLAAVLAVAGCSRQESAWHDARRENSAAAYEEYLARHPAGSHAAEAREALAAMREAGDWARAVRLGTPEAWQRYLAGWPGGRHVEEARRLLVEFIPPAPPPAPAPAPATAGPVNVFEVQLGAWSDEALAGAGLARVVDAHGHLLVGLATRIVPPGPGSDRLWRLRSGPLEEAAARTLCARLRSAGADCVPARAMSAGDAPP